MVNKLYEIVAKVMNTDISKINDMSSHESVKGWDSFSVYVLLNEIETEFKIRFTMEETLDIKNVGDFKRHLLNHGIVLEG